MAALARGTRVWVHSAAEGWRQGTVAAAPAADGAACRVALDVAELGKGAGPEVSVPLADLQHANPALLDGVRWVQGAGSGGPPGRPAAAT